MMKLRGRGPFFYSGPGSTRWKSAPEEAMKKQGGYIIMYWWDDLY